MSSCRTFRLHSFTTFQSHARERVIALDYALPLPKEYQAAAAAAVSKSSVLNPDDLPRDGDWMRYLVRVLGSDSMRARRRIWELAKEVRGVYRERIVGSIWADVVVPDGNGGTIVQKNVRRSELENFIKESPNFRLSGRGYWW